MTSLRTAVVLQVEEDACEVWSAGERQTVGFVPPFPSPRVERVLPGHLVAIGDGLVMWRWYDAVVLGEEADGTIRLWEPAHGEVVAQRRRPASYEPGTRAYASAGLPGAEWWVAGLVAGRPESADVELAEVDRLYS
jgi:hypothetical protein